MDLFPFINLPCFKSYSVNRYEYRNFSFVRIGVLLEKVRLGLGY